jgi:hypothetical protein
VGVSSLSPAALSHARQEAANSALASSKRDREAIEADRPVHDPVGDVARKIRVLCVVAVCSDQPIPVRRAGQAVLLAFRKFDDSVGDYRDDRVCSIPKMQGRARHFECDPHDALDLGVDVLTVQVWSNRHAALPGLWRVLPSPSITR